jgi:hypothetical protein
MLVLIQAVRESFRVNAPRRRFRHAAGKKMTGGCSQKAKTGPNRTMPAIPGIFCSIAT